MVLAFMAQHIWEVGASVFAVLLIGQGLFWLLGGASEQGTQGMSNRTVRRIGGVAICLGAGIAVAAFAVDAEQPGAHGHDGWGGAPGIILLCVWVALICIGPVSKVIRARDRDRKDTGPR